MIAINTFFLVNFPDMKKPPGNILESETQRDETHVPSTVDDPKKHEGYELYMEIKVVRRK